MDIWTVIDKMFQENPEHLVGHHLESYNDFFKNGIFRIFKEKNPVRLNANYDPEIDDYRNQCLLYFGGKDGDKLYFGKPIIYDDKENSHYMFPNEARLRNMTYGMTIHYDIDVEYIDILADGEEPHLIGAKPVRVSETQETEQDYPKKHSFDNFKKGSDKMEGGPQMEGGAKGDGAKGDRAKGDTKKKAPIQKVPRTRRVQRKFEITPALSAAIKEATEKSMIGPNTQRRTITLEKVYLGKFPIMLHSDFCILKGLTPETRFSMGECRNDLGGYFIIQGKEKTVVCQEKFADNMLYIRAYEEDGISELLFSSEIRSVSENASKPVRTLAVQMVAPTPSYTNRNIVVNIPNVRKPVPLFIVFRALGVLSDKTIIEMCLLDLDKYEQMVDVFIPSVHDAGGVMTQQLALDYIASLTKGKRTEHAQEILADYFLPHIGEVNFLEKAFFLGHMVLRMLFVASGLEQPTDRDNFKYKRIELVGSLLYDLFREYYTAQQKAIHLQFDKRLNLNKSLYANDLPCLINTFSAEILKERVLEDGFRKAFKGNWGSKANTKRIGVVQDLNRLSFNSYLSHLRKTNLPMDSGAKLVGPRVLHNSQWGFIDPIDTPDGANIGLHKTLAIATHISRGGTRTREPMIEWLREKSALKNPCEVSPKILAQLTKVMVNGFWAGSVEEPRPCVEKIKLYRRNGLLPIYVSATFDIQTNTIYVYTDDGRLCRPIFYRDGDKISYENKEIAKALERGDYSWADLTTGFNPKRSVQRKTGFYELYELYEGLKSETNPAKLDRFLDKKAVIDYIDSSESENALIAMSAEEFPNKPYTHLELHESLLFGTMCNLINFPENNPPTRNSFSCGQSRQACSLYHTNHRNRMDKTAVVLNYGQIPLIKSRYMEYINREEMPYGENAIVAIMCYSGYNMEDSILINEGSLNRGLFHTTYYSTYETHEENEQTSEGEIKTAFVCTESETNIVRTKTGYDYSKLDKYGLIREGTEIDDKTVLIGMATSSPTSDLKSDASKTPKKGQLGIVDKTFMTEGDEGERIAKVRVRETRIPNLGDKMASRAGQKGTIGMVVPEADMPFTRNGLRPDLIINPHAIPSRMTIGQLIECVMGKTCALLGGFGDCTAFVNKGTKIGVFGEALSSLGYHSSGNEVLYNGMSGEQTESEIFIGPTYYMRLKHMVKDKINHRAQGPRTALTRQPVSGRANDGGLRIGEMERDSVISHGMVDFLTESMMKRADEYKVAICNTTGLFAIYNKEKNLFLSPMADGPIRFVGSLDGSDMNIENVSNFGRSFSVVAVPYSLKLLVQELQAINIQMRFITEDNIDQMETMMNSKNLENLTSVGTLDDIRKKLIQMTRRGASENPIADDWDSTPVLPSGFQPSTPNYMTPDYNKSDTPTYAPDYNKSDTPTYAPDVPEYMPPPLEYRPDYEPPLAATPPSPLYEPSSPSPYEAPLAATPPSYEAPLPATPEYRPEMGEIVFFRGDNPPVEWTVISIGNQVVTLQNGEDIKVAQMSDVYQPPLSVPMQYPMEQPQQQQQQQQQVPSGINFAPVINVGTTTTPAIASTTVSEKPAETPNEDIFKNLVIKKV